jgi:hypothetical protein
MDTLFIRKTSETPQINLNGDAGIFSITGFSYPENVVSFYKPVFDYIEEYKLNPREKTILEFNWIYYNTGTSKMIVRIILELKDLSKEFEVKWFCQNDVDIMIDKGKELKEMLDINLSIIFV